MKKRKPRPKKPSNTLKVKDTKIASISDENSELHPLLEKLFKTLPNIEDVEYRQGVNEKGADFVLRKRDETFENQEYVGVVAKVGSIHQSFGKMEEQIDECFNLPRYVRNGKEQIYLQEVWCIFTGGSTPNAEEKINVKFRAHKIKFIDGKGLEKLVDKYVPYYWDEVPLEVAKYLTDVDQNLKDMDRSVSLISAETASVYIEPDIFTYPANKYRQREQKLKHRSNKVNIYEEIREKRFLFIEGDMGVGKSKLIRTIGQYYSKPGTFNDTGILPLPVSFRDLVNDFDGEIEKCLAAKVSTDLATDLKSDVTYLLLIDGMDEKRLDPTEQVEYLSLLIESARTSNRIKIVLTSRPLKGFDDAVQLDANISTYLLHPLSFAKSLQLMKQICASLNMADRIVEDLRKSLLFKELPKNPIAVILLANLLNENRQEIPANLTELYAKYIEFALGRWDISKGFQEQKEYEALQRIMMRLAEYIVDNDLRSIGIDEAKGFFTEYLSKRNLDLNVNELFSLMMDRTELMLFSSDGRSISFKHKTFAEFLYAKYAKEYGELEIDNRAFQPYWMNTFFFYLGLKKDAEDSLSALIRIVPSDSREEILRVLNMGNFLLAGYLTPYEVVHDAIYRIAIEAAEIYQKIVTKEADTLFSRLPRMHILWLLQMLLRDGYGFTYFLPAIENAAVEIANSDVAEATKAYSLFFLNVIYMEITKDHTFHYLLENIKNLPVDISLAFLAETSDVKKQTDLMKRAERRIYRNLKGTKQQVAAIERLYDDPIKSFERVEKGLPPAK